MKFKIVLITALFLFCITGFAQADLVTIGTANYGGSNYNLIYDDNDTGYDGGTGLVWLDYTNPRETWANQVAWADSLNNSGALTYNLIDGYTVSGNLETGWRLPDAVDSDKTLAEMTDIPLGHEGDPDEDGIYTYVRGYNLANSEIGHLFYTELGNLGQRDTNDDLVDPTSYGLLNPGAFSNLEREAYWYGTKACRSEEDSWFFSMHDGYHSTASVVTDIFDTTNKIRGIAVHEVSFDGGSQPAPVPETCTILLLGTGLLGLVKVGRKKFKRQ